ncbi:MAG: hypothetical protein ACLFTG_06335, partial [Alphaproteobacteria bacterium]
MSDRKAASPLASRLRRLAAAGLLLAATPVAAPVAAADAAADAADEAAVRATLDALAQEDW